MGLHSRAEFRQKMLKLAVQCNLYLNHFPKHEKYGLCLQIRTALYDTYGHCIEAEKKFHKKTALGCLDTEHEKLRWLVHMAFELGYFGYTNGVKSDSGERRYLIMSAMIDEIGRMIGGWINSEREGS